VPKEKKIQEVKEEKKLNVEHKTSSANQEKTKASESLIPFTMRNSFFEDPFFKDNWMDIETSQKHFFDESRKRFEGCRNAMESSVISSNIFDTNTSSMNANALKMPDIFGKRSDSLFNSEDSNLIRIQDDDTKLEISLDTTGYKPDELKVSAGQGMICVEGKHEEKSEAGQVMVARQFSKKYSLPASARAEEVVSNLSQDGVLVISVPKREAIQQENRSVPIAVK
jgi:HSP20 family molecular chaperone IbpA